MPKWQIRAVAQYERMSQMGYKAGREKQIPALYDNEMYMEGYVMGRRQADQDEAATWTDRNDEATACDKCGDTATQRDAEGLPICADCAGDGPFKSDQQIQERILPNAGH
jgi:hypothetical protein